VGIAYFYACFLQVLTGEVPFRGIPQSALGYAVVHGRRPDKPENASAIGFSDPLWDFAQRCWDGRIEMRPKAGEVVAHLWEAAAGWDGPTPEPTQRRKSDPDPPSKLLTEQWYRRNPPTVSDRRPGESHRSIPRGRHQILQGSKQRSSGNKNLPAPQPATQPSPNPASPEKTERPHVLLLEVPRVPWSWALTLRPCLRLSPTLPRT